MAIGNGVVVRFFADTSSAQMGINKLNTALGTSLGPSDKLTRSFGFMQAALIAGATAAGAFAIKLGTDAVQAAMAEEKELTKLNTTLENLGFGAASNSVNQFIDDLQYVSATSDSVLRPSFDRLIRATKDVGEAQRVLKIALDVSAGTGKDLATVANALGKAYEGNTGALGRLGVGLDKATLKSGDLDTITGTLAKTFAGQSAKAAGTLSGKIETLNIAADELKEAFGQGLIGNVDGTTVAIDNATQAMRDAQPKARDLGGQISGLGLLALEASSRVQILWTAISRGDLGLLREYVMALSETNNVEMDKVAAKVRGIGQQFTYSQYAAYGAAAAARTVVDSYGDAATRAARLADEQARAAAAADKHKDKLTGGGGLKEALEATSPAMRDQIDLLRQNIDLLTGENGVVASLGKALQAYNDYRTGIESSLKGGASLSSAISEAKNNATEIARLDQAIADALDPEALAKAIAERNAFAGSADVAAIYAKQLGDVQSFNTALTNLATQLPATPGAAALIQQFASAGANSASAFLSTMSVQTAMNLATSLEAASKSATGSANILAQHFYGEGVNAQIQLVEGMVTQIQKDEKKLRKLGQKIGQPIGEALKAEITAALNEALAAAASARAAAAAPIVVNNNFNGIVGDPVATGKAVAKTVATAAARTS